MQNYSALLYPFLAAVVGSAAQANNSDYFDESDLMADIPMVSAGARMEQKRHHAPSSVTVIDSETIRALAPNGLVDVFRLVPGFMSFYINASMPGLSGRDLTDDDPRRLEVRVNGRSVYVPTFPTISWNSLGIMPEDIDRIEVVRGSNVPAYGSNAIIGAVNITTKSPLKESGTAIRATIGEQNTRNINIRSNFELPNGFAQLRFGHRENDGFDVLADSTSVDHLVFNAVFTPNLQDSFDIEVGASEGSFGIGDGDYVDYFSDDDNSSYWLSLGWKRDAGDHQWNGHFSYYDSQSENILEEYVSVAEGWNQEQLDYYLGGNPDVKFDFGWGVRNSELWEGELEYQYTFNESLRVLAGAGYKYQNIHAPDRLSHGGTIDYGILYGFSNAEWQLSPKWLINVGFMAENQEMDDTNVSPRASLHYQLHPQHNFRISSSRAYRSPSVFESHRMEVKRAYDIFVDYNLLSEPDLAAEQMDTMELAYYGSFFDGKLDIDWRVFEEEMEGGIDHVKWWVDHNGWEVANEYDEGDPSDPDPRAYFFTNSKNWRVSGYDMQLKWRPTDGTQVSLQYANSRLYFTRIRHWHQAPNGVKRDKQRVPNHVGSLLITQDLGAGWSAALMSYHQSDVEWRGGEFAEGYFRHDISINKDIKFSDYQLRLNLKVENVTDETNFEFETLNYFKRIAYINATLQW